MSDFVGKSIYRSAMSWRMVQSGTVNGFSYCSLGCGPTHSTARSSSLLRPFPCRSTAPGIAEAELPRDALQRRPREHAAELPDLREHGERVAVTRTPCNAEESD